MGLVTYTQVYNRIKALAGIPSPNANAQTQITEYVNRRGKMAFDATTDALLQKHGMTSGGMTEQEVTQAVISTFGATEAPAPQWAKEASAPAGGFQVRIKGQQHGPIPAWLHAECAKVGVNEVWDNRDGLQANPKRPWFKAVTGDKAFWEPRAKR
jgi:hypothetical protein